MRSDQEETDSRVVLYCIYAAEQGYQYARVRSPDSDIFWILLYHAREIDITILFDTGHGNKKCLINITNLSKHYTEQMCEAMLAHSLVVIRSAISGVLERLNLSSCY